MQWCKYVIAKGQYVIRKWKIEKKLQTRPRKMMKNWREHRKGSAQEQPFRFLSSDDPIHQLPRAFTVEWRPTKLCRVKRTQSFAKNAASLFSSRWYQFLTMSFSTNSSVPRYLRKASQIRNRDTRTSRKFARVEQRVYKRSSGAETIRRDQEKKSKKKKRKKGDN